MVNVEVQGFRVGSGCGETRGSLFSNLNVSLTIRQESRRRSGFGGRR